MNTPDISHKSFQDALDVQCVFRHCEKLKVPDALDFDEAIDNFEVLYKKGLAKSTPSQLSKYRDVLVGDSKIDRSKRL